VLGGRGAGGIPRDIVLQARPLRFLAGAGGGELGGALGPVAREVGIAAGILRQLAAPDVEDGVRPVGEEVAAVAGDARAGEVADFVIDRLDGATAEELLGG